MRLLVAACALGVASFASFASRAADACSCMGPRLGIVYPQDGATIAPNDRVLIRVRAGESPEITALYTDGRGGRIEGVLERIGTYGYEVWGFRPPRGFTRGRQALLRRETVPEQNVEVTIGDELDETPPEMRGALALHAYETHFTPESMPTSCDDGASNSPGGFDRIDAIESGASLESPLPASLIQRLFLYGTPGARPSDPTNVGLGEFAFRRTGCSANWCGHPALPLDFVPGDTVCARIEWEDPAGNRGGYDDEACTTVAYQLFWLDGFNGCRPPPLPDAGSIDAAATGDAGPDAGTSEEPPMSGAAGGRGCACGTSGVPRASPFAALFLLALSIASRAVRRPGGGHEHAEQSQEH